MADPNWGDVWAEKDPSRRQQKVDDIVHGQIEREKQNRQLILQEQDAQREQFQRARDELRGSRGKIATQALRQMRYGPKEVGKYIIPHDADGKPIDTLAAHAEFVQDTKQEIGFSTSKYPLFDGLIAKAYYRGGHKLENPNDPSVQALRDNIAIVRNYVCGALFGKDVDAGEEQQIQAMQEMAVLIGNALQRGDSWIHKPWHYTINKKDANTPGDGAEAIYKLLLKEQSGLSLVKPWTFLGFRKFPKWNLPRIEDTPFSREGMTAPPPRDTADPLADWPRELDLTPQKGITEGFQAGVLLAEIANEIENRATRMSRVELLAHETRAEAVEEARNILRHLKIKFQTAGPDALMQQPLNEALQQADDLSRLTTGFETSLRAATRVDANILNTPVMRDAQDAMGKLAYLLKLEAVATMHAEERSAAAKILADEMKSMPEPWKNIHNVSLRELLEKIEDGMNAAERTLEETRQRHAQQQHNAPIPVTPASTTKTQTTPPPAPQQNQQLNQAAMQQQTAQAVRQIKLHAAQPAKDHDPKKAAEIAKLVKEGKLKPADLNKLKTAETVSAAVPVKPTALPEEIAAAHAALAASKKQI